MKLHRPLLTLAATIIFTIAPITAFFFALLAEENYGQVGGFSFVVIAGESRTSDTHFLKQLDDYADSTGGSITVERLAIDTPRHERHFFSTSVEQVWTTKSFERGKVLTFHPLLDIPDGEIRFVYNVDPGRSISNSESRQTLTEIATRHGHTIEPMTDQLLPILLIGPVAPTFTLIILAAFFLSLIHTVTQTNTVGVSRLFGHTFLKYAIGDLSQRPVQLACAALIPTVIALAALYSYNQLANCRFFFITYATVMFSGICATTLGYLLGYQIARTPGIVGAVRGKAPTRLLVDSVAALRVLSFGLLILTVPMFVSNTTAALAIREDMPRWLAHSDPIYASVGNGRDIDALAPGLSEADLRGDLILSSVGINSDPDIPATMEVNREWLINEGPPELIKSNANSSTVLLAMPEGATEKTRERVKQEHVYLRKQADKEGVSDLKIELVKYSNPYQAFSYFTDIPVMIDSPIIIVHPIGLPLHSDYDLSSFVSGHQILFKDKTAFQRFLSANPPAEETVLETGRISDLWLAQSKVYTTQAMLFTFIFIVTIGLWLILAVALSLSYYQVHRRRLEVGHLLGVNPWRLRLGLVAMEATFVILSSIWIIKAVDNRIALKSFNSPTLLSYPGLANGFHATIITILTLTTISACIPIVYHLVWSKGQRS
ncbi:hypothetical protein [Corynebacterium uterequi]|uniref:Uncharacterized protein n=1 Tax=Corynebacterium uterequi TaxID=1072256 RepID=A0A0G3HGI3_9CORY|nr:hypothetical protein [Corynebacterium uterequi]AKK11865.1 hypothetical protein CUTER_09485 [Corynebacterium uterequi]